VTCFQSIRSGATLSSLAFSVASQTVSILCRYNTAVRKTQIYTNVKHAVAIPSIFSELNEFSSSF